MASSHPATLVPPWLARESAPKPPTLRFIYWPDEKRTNPLVTVPYGFTPFQVDEKDLAAGAVIGEIRATDDKNAVVYFVTGSDADRRAARRPLRAWARKDEWKITFADGTHSLTEPDPPVETHWTPGICPLCREQLGTGYVPHLKWQSRGWMNTTCPCGGRMRWYKRSRRRASGGEVDA
jgi:hypothetical protein